MNVQQLSDRLSDEDPAATVRFNYQESYPLQDDLRGVWTLDAGEEECDTCGMTQQDHCKDSGMDNLGLDTCDTFTSPRRSNAGIVYLVSGGQAYETPYGHRAAFEGAY